MTEQPRLSGPPEPIRREDGSITVAHTEGSEITTQDLGEWECQRCGVTTEAGVVNGELAEPLECQGCEREGPFNHAGPVTVEEAKQALRAIGGDTQIWRPPEAVDAEAFEDLWGDVRTYIQDHWDADDPAIYNGLTAYAISTWLREELTFVPHLMLMGKTTGGKTRLLNTLARVSYRAQVTASATAASLFRLIDAYDVTAFVSEYHGLDYDAQRELDAVVRAGQKRGEIVNRAEPTSEGYEPTVFDPFTHIAIATQYTPDDDIVNRCIQVRSSPADREMPMTLDEEEGQRLRDRLLYARFRLLGSEEWDEARAEALEFLADKGIEARTREKLLGPVTVAAIWNALPNITPWVEEVVEQDREAQADSEDALVVEVIRDLALEELGEVETLGEADRSWSAVEVPLKEVAERFEEVTGEEKTASWVGHVRRRLGLEKERKRDGTVIQDPELGAKLRDLCEDHNLDLETLATHQRVEELNGDGGFRRDCPECGKLATMTHRHVEEGHKMCQDCAEEVIKA